MVWYCGVTFTFAAAAFVLKHLLLRDAARSRLSKAEEFVAPVEVIMKTSFLYCLHPH